MGEHFFVNAWVKNKNVVYSHVKLHCLDLIDFSVQRLFEKTQNDKHECFKA